MLAALMFLPQAVTAADAEIDFGRDIRPILSDKCFKCHGPDAEARQADLRLDVRDGLFEDRGGYASFVPGRPDASEAIRRVTHADPAERMPPADANLRLTPAEIQLLRRWVEQGAAWKQHWSFEPVRRPAPPQVSDPAACRNSIDYFVLARLDREQRQRPRLAGLSAVAGPEALIRRVTLDLTGLPPTPAEIDAFLQDDSPDAYERVVDRLLRSSRYGEQMAVTWLDAARYADTDGYQNDGPRTMWRWRDWVIDAYNENMPFDRFTIEQLAGDLLPSATLDQKIATGFNRNHRYNSEAGLVLAEFLLENAVDRVDTSSTVWMGLTMGCARCHDHKFDPIRHSEYYRLVAFFDKVSESGRAVKFGNSEPWVVAPTKQQQQQLAGHNRKVQAAASALIAASPAIAAMIERCCNGAQASAQSFTSIAAPSISDPVVKRGLTGHFSFDAEQPTAKVEAGNAGLDSGVMGRAASFAGTDVLTLGAVGAVQCQKRSSIAFWLQPQDTDKGVILSRQSRNTRRPGLAVELRQGHLQFYIITRWVAGVGAVETIPTLQPRRWVHVCLTNDGSQRARGMKIYIDGQPAPTRILFNTNSNTGGTAANAVLRIGGGVHGSMFTGQLDELRFYDRTLFDDEIAVLAEPDSVATILKTPPKQRNDRQRRKLQAWFLENALESQKGDRGQTGRAADLPSHDESNLRTRLQEFKRLYQDLVLARQAHQEFWDALPTSMVMEQMDPPRPTFVRIRGVYNNYGPRVDAGVPTIFAGLPPDAPRNRLSFARWLVSGNHPLTARVAVNRYWQKYFGLGLVKTSEDFGVQGERPSHPELLDWLASEFVRSGWDVKALQKLIVMSATYRQSSHLTSQRRRQDPDNRLLSRGPRERLPAHVLRDQAMFVSGLLVERLGGPSVSPYQPTNLWKEMSNMTYRQSKGQDLYRRSLYTVWKRTVAPPSMSILDAADRESCWVRTKRTNTPLQALTLLNETIFVESARHLAQRMIREGGEGGEGGQHPVAWAFRLVTSRRPRPDEFALLERARQEYIEEFRRNPQDAHKLISVGESAPAKDVDPIELAANTVLANVLLNLDEVLTKN